MHKDAYAVANLLVSKGIINRTDLDALELQCTPKKAEPERKKKK